MSREAIERARIAEDPANLGPDDLLSFHGTIHEMWRVKQESGEVTAGGERKSDDELITYHTMIVAEMRFREKAHESVDGLDEQSAPILEGMMFSEAFDPMAGADVETEDLPMEFEKGTRPPFTVFGNFPLKVATGVLKNIVKSVDTYVEAFCGPAQIFYLKPPSPHEVLGDLDKQMIRLHQTVRTLGERDFTRLAGMRWGKISKVAWKEMMDREPYEDAIHELWRIMVLKRNSVGGIARRTKTHWANIPIPDFKHRALIRLRHARERWEGANVTTRVSDFQKTIDAYDGKNTFIFLDPPYVAADEYYRLKFPVAEGERLMKSLDRVKGTFLMLHNPHPLIKGSRWVARRFRWPCPFLNLSIASGKITPAGIRKFKHRCLYVLSNARPFRKDAVQVPGADLEKAVATPLPARMSGLMLEAPHAEWAVAGVKRGMVKASRIGSPGEPVMAVSDGLAWGMVRLGTGREITLAEFDHLHDYHLVSDEEREKWWPNADMLWFYPLQSLGAFASPQPIEKVEAEEGLAIFKQTDSYLGYPDEGKKYAYAMQHHRRGRSNHTDFRIESREKDIVLGWTIADMIAGVEENSVDEAAREALELPPEAEMTSAQKDRWVRRMFALAQERDGEREHFKIDWETGRFQMRENMAGTLVPAQLRSFRKMGEPKAWLTVEGVTPPFPAPGATVGFRGVFTTMDGTKLHDDEAWVEYGRQAPDFHEYFLTGGTMRGRLVFRQFPAQAVAKGFEDQELEKQMAVLPAGVTEGGGIEELMWAAIQPQDQRPYFLSTRAVENGAMPPLGFSGLPKVVRDAIPAALAYWKETGAGEALVKRDRLVEKIEKEELEFEWEELLGVPEVEKAKSDFKLILQWWKGSDAERGAPSRQQYHVLVRTGEKLTQWTWQIDPLKSGRASGSLNLEPEKQIWTVEGEVESTTPLTPAEGTPSFVERLDAGPVTILEDGDVLKKLDFRGSQLKGLWIATRDSPQDVVWRFERNTEDTGGGDTSTAS